jgi:predicted RNA binding protein with dsRBD fold (UPF0201 family)
MLKECKSKKCQNKLHQLQWREGIRKTVRPRRKWSDKIEGDLTAMRIKKKGSQ